MLDHLTLYLEYNDLGDNVENMKYLSYFIKKLPKDLKNLELRLSDNNLD